MIIYDIKENKLCLYFDEKQIDNLVIYETKNCPAVIKKLFSHCKTQNHTRLFFCFDGDILKKVLLPAEDLLKITYFFVYQNKHKKPQRSYYRNSIKNIEDYGLYSQINNKLSKYSKQGYISIRLIDLLKEYNNYQESKPSIISFLFELNLKKIIRLKNYDLSKYKFYPVCRDIYFRFCKSMNIKRIKFSDIKDLNVRFNARLFSRGLLNNTDLVQYKKICDVRSLIMEIKKS